MQLSPRGRPCISSQVASAFTNSRPSIIPMLTLTPTGPKGTCSRQAQSTIPLLDRKPIYAKTALVVIRCPVNRGAAAAIQDVLQRRLPMAHWDAASSTVRTGGLLSVLRRLAGGGEPSAASAAEQSPAAKSASVCPPASNAAVCMSAVRFWKLPHLERSRCREAHCGACGKGRTN